ncbi:hypothetical protein MPDQ_003050 [Monascus purpureus]|uniref:Noranthrone monooxygenase n=1 Tax=Monascus purpureus TaxID=5098 RepID=A0A507R3I8_MONPU|nr:hypothetical protein MPDQ_003050 [Monascus purpureus]BDD59380.1 hypothetical protein MAP00_004589 [Monascus purpureus]
MSLDTGNGIRIAQAVGIISSAFAAGGIFAISTFSIPNLLLPLGPEITSQATTKTATAASPKLIAKQWLQLYNKGKKVMPSIALSAALAYGYLARVDTKATWYYLPAIWSTMGIVPYTLAVMSRVNRAIAGYAEGSEKPVPEGDLVRLLKTWGRMNYVRALGPLVGSILGFYAAFVV